METFLAALQKKKEPERVLLPVVQKEHGHEGSCGDGCGCGSSGEDGCCGG